MQLPKQTLQPRKERVRQSRYERVDNGCLTWLMQDRRKLYNCERVLLRATKNFKR